MAENLPTLRDIAGAAGVTVATVSRALGNNSLVAPSTRERIRALATRMGYQRDPGLQALSKRRWSLGSHETRFTIACLTWRADSKPARMTWLRPFLEQFAMARNISLSILDLSEYTSSEAVLHVLEQRAVSGLVVTPLNHQPFALAPIWQRYPAVSCHSGDFLPEIPLVDQDYFFNHRFCLQALVRMGSKRIGILLPEHPGSQAQLLRQAAVLSMKSVNSRTKFLSLPAFGGSTRSALEWITEASIDGIFCDYSLHQKLKSSVAPGIPFACAFTNPMPGQPMGFYYEDGDVVRHALDLLIQMIAAGHTATAQSRITHRIAAHWWAG